MGDGWRGLLQAIRKLPYHLILGGIGLCLLLSQPSKTLSEESGTLVMAARTRSAVVLAVDSKITPKNHIEPRIAGERKLVDIGDTSACAVEGWLGDWLLGVDVSDALRQWVRDHPKKEADDALDELKAEAALWDRQHYPVAHLPNGRSVGDDISILVCGAVVDGKPSILRGGTYVNPDGTAGERRRPSFMGGTLYVQGVLDTSALYAVLIGPVENIHRLLPDANLDPLLGFRDEVHANAFAMKALELWSASVNSSSAFVDTPAPTWDQSALKNLFLVVFESVEKRFPNVAQPNNVRIITASGRESSTVEAGSW